MPPRSRKPAAVPPAAEDHEDSTALPLARNVARTVPDGPAPFPAGLRESLDMLRQIDAEFEKLRNRPSHLQDKTAIVSAAHRLSEIRKHVARIQNGPPTPKMTAEEIGKAPGLRVAPIKLDLTRWRLSDIPDLFARHRDFCSTLTA